MPENNLARTAAGTAASASLYADQAGDLFGLEISRLLQDDPQGSLPAETAEMEEDEEDEDERAESAASSPYNPVLRPVSPFEPQEVRLTPGEADSIVEAMREDGVPANVLNAVKDAGRTAGGATLDMLMNAARKALNGERAELSKADGAQLSSLSGKLAGAQSRELAQLLASASESGSASDARNALAAVLNSLNNASSVSMNKEEMSALLKALGISGDTSKGILAAFDDHRSLTMKGGDFAELLKPAGAELASRVNQLDSALASLQKQAAPVMKEARRREELERMAGMREDQAVSRSRILIRDTATLLPDAKIRSRRTSRPARQPCAIRRRPEPMPKRILKPDGMSGSSRNRPPPTGMPWPGGSCAMTNVSDATRADGNADGIFPQP